jgi:hypothetical protein
MNYESTPGRLKCFEPREITEEGKTLADKGVL